MNDWMSIMFPQYQQEPQNVPQSNPGRVISTDAPRYDQLAQFSNTGGGFGMGAYNRAKASGLNNRTIRSMLAGSGLQIGGAVADILNVNPILTPNWSTQSTGADQRPILAAQGGGGAAGWGSTSGLVSDSQYALQMGGNTGSIAHGGWGSYFDPSWDQPWATRNVGGYVPPQPQPSSSDMWQGMMAMMMEQMMNPQSNAEPVKEEAPKSQGPQFSYATSGKPSATATASNQANKISTATADAKKKALAAPTLQTLNI